MMPKNPFAQFIAPIQTIARIGRSKSEQKAEVERCACSEEMRLGVGTVAANLFNHQLIRGVRIVTRS